MSKNDNLRSLLFTWPKSPVFIRDVTASGLEELFVLLVLFCINFLYSSLFSNPAFIVTQAYQFFSLESHIIVFIQFFNLKYCIDRNAETKKESPVTT